MLTNEDREDLFAQIKTLRETIWEGRGARPDVNAWLDNFTGEATGSSDEERDQALFMLAHFLYYGTMEIEVLLKSAYRDHVVYPIYQSAREAIGGTLDASAIEPLAAQILDATRFLGLGSPSESGTHLTYPFRQVNSLRTGQIIDSHQLFVDDRRGALGRLRDVTVTRYVFIDDVCGSGQQLAEYAGELVKDIKIAASRAGLSVSTHYICLFGFSSALQGALGLGFDSVRAVHVMDDSVKAFSPDCVLFRKPPSGVDVTVAKSVAGEYGKRAIPAHPFGYRDGQLMLGFHHNTPDNTLPIFWADAHNSRAANWTPIFKRHGKHA